MDNIEEKCIKLGERIRQKRIENNMSQEELAHKVGYSSRATINKFEKNARNLKQDKLKLIADALNTTPSYLMGWDDTNTPPAFTPMTKFKEVKEYSEKNNIPLATLMGGRDIQPEDYENIKNARIHEVERAFDIRTGVIEDRESVGFHTTIKKAMSDKDKEMINLFTQLSEEQQKSIIALMKSMK